MKLDIRTVKNHRPVDFDCGLDFSGVKLWGQKPFRSPVAIKGRVADNGDYYEISYSARFVIHTECARCLKPLELEKYLEFEHALMEPEDSGSPQDEDLPLEDGILDIGEMAAGDILPEIDGAELCSPDCKGLCPACGCDRNERECACDTAPPDPRFDKLREYLQDVKED